MKPAASFPVRFCWHAVGVPPLFLVMFMAMVVYAGVSEWLDAGSSDGALALIVVGQMLAASTGFTGPATRGYLDPLLVSGCSRLVVGSSLFVAATLPGWVAWGSVGVIEAITQRSLDVAALRPAGLVAMLLVSCVSWSSTLRARRLTGGLVWLGLGILSVVSGKVRGLLVIAKMSREEIRDIMWDAFGSGLVLPTVVPFVAWPAVILVLFTLVALAALAAGLTFIRYRQIPLSRDS